MSFDPIFTLPQVVLLIALSVSGAAWLYQRTIQHAPPGLGAGGRKARRALAILRVALVAIIASLLLNPIASRTNQNSAKPPLLILIDSSRSMAIKDVDGRSRFE